MRIRKEGMGEILGNVCWFRSIVNSVNSWSGVTLVLAATLYSVMESQLQPTGFHKKIEHHLNKDYFIFWQHLGQSYPPSARKHLYIYMEKHLQLFQLVFLIIVTREGGGDPVYKGTGNTCARKLRGICRIDPFWDIFYKTSHGQLLPKTPLLENQIWLLWINDWLLLMNKMICVNFALCNCLFVRGGTLCAGLVWPMCPTQPPAGSTASAPISRLIIARTSILVSSKMVILTMTQVLLSNSATVVPGRHIRGISFLSHASQNHLHTRRNISRKHKYLKPRE